MILAQVVSEVSTNVPDTTAADIAKVFQDFHMNVSIGTVTLGLLALAKLCTYYRNFALKNKTAEQVNPLSRAIAHVAGNSLPKAADAPMTENNPVPVITQAAPVSTATINPPITNKQ